MSQSPGASPAAAGALLIGSILACAGVGLGIGALVGATLPLAIAAGAIGVIVGFRLVYNRFKQI